MWYYPLVPLKNQFTNDVSASSLSCQILKFLRPIGQWKHSLNPPPRLGGGVGWLSGQRKSWVSLQYLLYLSLVKIYNTVLEVTEIRFFTLHEYNYDLKVNKFKCPLTWVMLRNTKLRNPLVRTKLTYMWLHKTIKIHLRRSEGFWEDVVGFTDVTVEP